VVGKHMDLNFQFGIIMPPGTPAVVMDASEPGEPEVKSTEPPAAEMVPAHWNPTSKCHWESTDDLITTLAPDVRDQMEIFAHDTDETSCELRRRIGSVFEIPVRTSP
jgi:hypothetical protein